MNLGKPQPLTDEELQALTAPTDESAVDGTDVPPQVSVEFSMDGYTDDDFIMLTLQGARQTIIELGAKDGKKARYYNELIAMMERAIAYADYYIVRGAGK